MSKAPESSKLRKARAPRQRVGTGTPTGQAGRLEPIPAFASEAQERAFWEAHDSTQYVDWSGARRVTLPKLKPTSKSISLRLPIGLLEALRIEANRRDVPYQSLIKVWLSEKVEKKAAS